MPRTRRNGRGGHDSDDDDDYSSSSSDMNDFVTTFAGRTVTELKAGKAIHYSKNLKKTIIAHGVTYAYAARAPPTLTVFLDLFLDKLAGNNLPPSKTLTKACVQSVATEISTLLSASGTGGLIKDEPKDEPVLVSTALIKVVEDDKLEMSMFKNGYLENMHAKFGRKMKAISAAQDSLPTSPSSLAKIVISHLVQIGHFNRPSGNNYKNTTFGGRPQAQPGLLSPARYSHSTRTTTKADARALSEREKSKEAQKRAYKNFAKLIYKGIEQEGMDNNLVQTCWKWNGESIRFNKALDYVGWQQWFLEQRINRDQAAPDTSTLPGMDDEEEEEEEDGDENEDEEDDE